MMLTRFQSLVVRTSPLLTVSLTLLLPITARAQMSGACCHAGGACTLETETSCTGMGGTFLGDATDCEPNCCAQTPTGSDCACETKVCEEDATSNRTSTLCGANDDCLVAHGPGPARIERLYGHIGKDASGGGSQFSPRKKLWESNSTGCQCQNSPRNAALEDRNPLWRNGFNVRWPWHTGRASVAW